MRLRHREIDLPKIAQLEVAELLPDTRSIWLEGSCSCKSFAAFSCRLAVTAVSCVCVACVRRGLEKGKLWRMCDKRSGLSPEWLLQGTCWVEKCVSQCWKVFLSPWALICWWAMGAPYQGERLGMNDNHSFFEHFLCAMLFYTGSLIYFSDDPIM